MKKLCLYVLLLAALASCSSERNTWTSKAFHNTTAHYNGYFYAREEIEKVEETILKSQVDDYNRILRLFPTFDSSLAKGYDKEIQEAIKMASISIQRHPRSKWVDDAYILVGKARHYSMDWGNAIQTYKYTNKISKDPEAKHLAVINLIRTYVEHQEFNNAQAAIDFLKKEDLNRTNRKKFLLEQAYFYQMKIDYDNMVRNLTAASPMLKKKDRRGRIYFIIGQVYQKLGFESEAYNYYRRCLSTNPEYEVDFYARLYMAQVTEISRNKDINAARKSFRKLLKDTKNKEFKDKIYYEMGVFELKQDNIKKAIEDFNLSIREGTNTRIDGEAYLRLGELYYETLKNYPLSQAYYDSAITTLPKDYENYDRIKARQEILNEFVKHLKTIEWQDSLLQLASLDSAALMAKVTALVDERKKAEEERAAREKKKKRNRIQIDANNNDNIFGGGDDERGFQENTENSGWYFANPSAIALGQSEFARKWGDIPLEDNWRRSSKEVVNRDFATTENTNAAAASQSNEPKKEEDPVAVEFAKIDKQIPRTEKAKQESLGKIEEAYFSLGGIYYFKLQENKNAVDAYQTLLNRFPQTEHEPEVLYTLYLILTKDSLAQEADHYASLLKSKHPNSTYAKLLINPNYLQESSQAAERQKALYKTAYDFFTAGRYDTTNLIVDEAMRIGETTFIPNLKLLKILVIGKTEDISSYQYALDQFIKDNPQADVKPYAEKLLNTSRQFKETQEKKRGIQYVRSFDEPHYFVLIYKKTEKLDELAVSTLEGFNNANFKEWSLKTSSINFNDEYALTFVSDLPRAGAALEYLKTFNEKLTSLSDLRNHKFNNFVITKDNFDIFYRTKGLDEYLHFFEKNYPTQSQ